MAKELIIMPNWIGDCVLALSVIHRKTSMQHADVTLLVPQKHMQLCGLLCDYPMIPYRRKTVLEFLGTLKTVRARTFDTVYVLPHSFSSAFFAFTSGIRRRRGVARELRQPFFTQALPLSLRDKSRHLTYEYAMVLETDFAPPDYWQGRKIDKSDTSAGGIVFCPGSRYGPAKRWNGFAALLKLLPGKEVTVLGDRRDAEAAEAVEAAEPDRVKNLAGKTTVVEAARIIAGAKVVVANDSGLMHLAGYLGTPVVGIFGSSSPAWTRPLGGRVKIAHAPVHCSPCFNRTCRHKRYECLERITPDQVASLIHQLIDEKHKSR